MGPQSMCWGRGTLAHVRFHFSLLLQGEFWSMPEVPALFGSEGAANSPRRRSLGAGTERASIRLSCLWHWTSGTTVH